MENENIEKIYDPVFEALFRQAVIDNYTDEINSIPPKEVLAEYIFFSPGFELRMKKLFAHYHRKAVKQAFIKYTKTAALILAISFSFLFALLLTNPDVRATVGNVIVEWFEQFTSITFTSPETGGEIINGEVIELRPYYLPEGYIMYSVERLWNVTSIVFSNDERDKIHFIYRPGYNASNFSIDNEHHIIEQRILGGYEAFISKATDEYCFRLCK